MTPQHKQTIVDLTKISLGIANDDTYYTSLISAAVEMAISAISVEGMTIDESDTTHLAWCAKYATWVFNCFEKPETPFPRDLRYNLNNIIFSQKASANNA